ncbi:hypothetical protein [Sharpea azabuensis]|uniref:hypothetical protein n=1 Tax=Sharpea azabuensis TaxID=322505 RepID=UPI001568EE43|nr:hypothetical protein [Sharpea azabuensis]
MNKVKKREKYELFGSKITVEYMDCVISDDPEHWIYGHCREHGDKFTIQISLEDVDGKPMTKDSIERTLRHELFHVICSRGQYINVGDDEPLIEWLSLCTFTLNKQGLKI